MVSPYLQLVAYALEFVCFAVVVGLLILHLRSPLSATGNTRQVAIKTGSLLRHRRWPGVAFKLVEQEGDMLTVTVLDTNGIVLGEPPVGLELKVNKSDVYRY